MMLQRPWSQLKLDLHVTQRIRERLQVSTMIRHEVAPDGEVSHVLRPDGEASLWGVVREAIKDAGWQVCPDVDARRDDEPERTAGEWG